MLKKAIVTSANQANERHLEYCRLLDNYKRTSESRDSAYENYKKLWGISFLAIGASDQEERTAEVTVAYQFFMEVSERADQAISLVSAHESETRFLRQVSEGAYSVIASGDPQ